MEEYANILNEIGQEGAEWGHAAYNKSPVAEFCQHDSTLSDFVKGEHFLSR
jgi:hypothetical protein